jgi:hypothetical protein
LRTHRLEGNHGFARDCWRAGGDRKRYETPGRLELVYGAAPRFIRIETLKCGDTASQSVFGRCETRSSKHTRGGREPNGWIGKPRRGRRSREHRLERSSNRERARTDSQLEQRSEVVGSRLSTAAPNDLLRTRMRRCGRFVLTPGQRSRPLPGRPIHLGGQVVRMMPRPIVRVARANTTIRFRTAKGRERAATVGATAELEATRAKPEPAETAREQRASRGVPAD